MKIAYIDKNFAKSSLEVIESANAIIEEFQADGFDLTLRQLYYQFVARDLIANKQSEYKRIGSIINDARLAGLISWHAIVDRTRGIRRNSHWDSPASILKSAAYSYAIDKWQYQDYRPEVWIEKDALIGVIADICEDLDVTYFSCRGYVSQSEIWSAARRLIRFAKDDDQIPVIIHLGDHDPSGIDMTRDITDRLHMFFGSEVDVNRIALNMDQVERYQPPPNPAKTTDSRHKAYIASFGEDSWELDALEPRVLARTIEQAVKRFRNEDEWQYAIGLEKEGRERIQNIADDMSAEMG